MDFATCRGELLRSLLHSSLESVGVALDFLRHFIEGMSKFPDLVLRGNIHLHVIVLSSDDLGSCDEVTNARRDPARNRKNGCKHDGQADDEDAELPLPNPIRRLSDLPLRGVE